MALDHGPDLTNPIPEASDQATAENPVVQNPDQVTNETPAVGSQIAPETGAGQPIVEPNQPQTPTTETGTQSAEKPEKKHRFLKPILAVGTTLGLLAGGAVYANSRGSDSSTAKTEQEATTGQPDVTTTIEAQAQPISPSDISFGGIATNLGEDAVEFRSPQQRIEAEKNVDLNQWASANFPAITSSISDGKPVDVAFGTCVSFSKTYKSSDGQQTDAREFFIEPIVVQQGNRTLYYVEEPDGSSFVVTETLPDGSTRHSSGLPGLEIDKLDSAQTASVIVSKPDESVIFDQYTNKGTYFSGQLTDNMASSVPFGEVLTVTNSTSLNNDAQQRKQLCADYIQKYNSTN